MDNMVSDSMTGAAKNPRIDSLYRWFVIPIVFSAALGVRMYHLNQPSLAFHPIRQFRSIVLARAYYWENIPSPSEWQQETVRRTFENFRLKEPPIMEYLTAWGYQAVGGEKLWIARVLSSLFWMIGGVFLYILASDMFGRRGALVSTVFYLFVPFGIFISRSFQPESLMIMMFMASLLAIWSYAKRESPMYLLVAACVVGAAILVKFVTIFPIIMAFLFITTDKYGLHRGLISRRAVCFLVVSLLLGLGYYVYLAFVDKHLQNVAHAVFIPHLLFDAFFWKGWLRQVGSIVGYIAVAGGLAGILLLSNRTAKTLLMGLWGGYFVYGIIFTYTTATHDYYQVHFVPIVALSLGPVGSLILTRLGDSTRKRKLSLAVLGICCVAVLITMGVTIQNKQFRSMNPKVKSSLEILCRFIGINPHLVKHINNDYQKEIAIAEEIGEILNHSTKTIILASAFKKPLEYYGRLGGITWPNRRDFQVHEMRGIPKTSKEEHFENILALYPSTEYFIVTDLEDFAEQEDLNEFLTSNFPLLVQNDDYLIFDLTKKID